MRRHLPLGMAAVAACWLAVPAAAQLDRPLAAVDGDGIRVYVAAPDATVVDLEVMVDGGHVCYLQGTVSSAAHRAHWQAGLFMAGQACLLPLSLSAEKGVRLQATGEVGLPDGTAVPVFLDEAWPLQDVFDLGLMILPDGVVAWDVAVACPWLYADEGSGYRRRVEIVRGVAGADAEATQVDRLTGLRPVDGALRLRLQEDKFEQAHIDYLAVAVGDVAILSPEPALAAIDGRYLVLERGDVIDLPVALPDGHAGPVDATIVSRGYYIPYRDLARR